jgi:hypothetical protein
MQDGSVSDVASRAKKLAVWKFSVWKFSSCDGCQLSLLDCESGTIHRLDLSAEALPPALARASGHTIGIGMLRSSTSTSGLCVRTSRNTAWMFPASDNT